MSDSQKIPPVESPRQSTDDSLERLEEDILEKQARSPAYRALYVHEQQVAGLKSHITALEERIRVIQDKLNQCENRLLHSGPRIAELEQAESTSKLFTVIETIGMGGGAICLSIASFSSDDVWKYSLLTGGVTASVFAIFAKVLFSIAGWPEKKNVK